MSATCSTCLHAHFDGASYCGKCLLIVRDIMRGSVCTCYTDEEDEPRSTRRQYADKAYEKQQSRLKRDHALFRGLAYENQKRRQRDRYHNDEEYRKKAKQRSARQFSNK